MKWMTPIIFLWLVLFSGCNKRYVVESVVDGDTIILKPFMPIRIIGIDAPEIDQQSQKFKDDVVNFNTSSEQELNMAFESKKELQRLVLNKKVTLKIDPYFNQEIQENGRSGRTLRFVFVGGDDIGKVMIQKGYARLWNMSLPLQNNYHCKNEDYAKEEESAKNLGLGIWKK
mgnify:CR=1 FL=1